MEQIVEVPVKVAEGCFIKLDDVCDSGLEHVTYYVTFLKRNEQLISHRNTIGRGVCKRYPTLRRRHHDLVESI